MKQLKVCILIPDFTICTGANTQALHLAKSLKKMGVEVFLVFSVNIIAHLYKPCYDKNFEEQLLASGIKIYKKPDTMGKKWDSYKFYLQLFWKLSNDYQIVYINGMSGMLCWFILFFKLMKKKVIVKMTGMKINDPKTLETQPEYNWLTYKLMALADRFIGTSTSLCESYRKSELLPDKKLVQIPNGVDTELFKPEIDQDKKREFKRKLGLPPEDKIVTYVGSVRRGKGLDVLIDSWVDLIKQYPNASLLIIGVLCPLCPTLMVNDQEFLKVLKDKVGLYIINNDKVIKLLRSTNTKNKIHVLGTKINIYEYLQATDIFAFLSRREGMPNALMEAMSTGLPSITSDIGEICGDLITNEEVGISASLENQEELVQKTIELLKNDEKRKIIGEKARQKILNEYKIEDIAQRHCSLYNELLGRK